MGVGGTFQARSRIASFLAMMPGDEVPLERPLKLIEAIADQAHDQHGIDCLLDGTHDAC
jgi:hypothetical protein